MEKLPPTSYVRLVDIWLIFGQLIPFIEVILLTLMELYNKEDDQINHHGFVRRVGSISPAQVGLLFLVGIIIMCKCVNISKVRLNKC